MSPVGTRELRMEVVTWETSRVLLPEVGASEDERPDVAQP